MARFEKRLSTFMAICITVFILTCLLLVLNFAFLGAALGKFAMAFTAVLISVMVITLSILIIGFVSSVAANRVVTASKNQGPRRKVAVKIHSVWRTDKGRVVGPDDTELEIPGYHIVLVTEQNQRIEVDTAPEVYYQCAEGSWGYAEIQGDWMGSYVRDAELYTKHSGR